MTSKVDVVKPSVWEPLAFPKLSPLRFYSPSFHAAVAFAAAACYFLVYRSVLNDQLYPAFRTAVLEYGNPGALRLLYVAGESVFLCLILSFVLSIGLELLGHHNADKVPGKYLLESSYCVMRWAVLSIQVFALYFLLIFTEEGAWYAPVVVGLSTWYQARFQVEQPFTLDYSDLFPKEAVGTSDGVLEMAQTGSLQTSMPTQVAKNLVEFLVFHPTNGRQVVGCGFVFKADNRKYAVTAHHVWTAATHFSRSGVMKPCFAISDFQVDQNTWEDFVLINLTDEVNSQFGSGFDHIVPKLSYELVQIPVRTTAGDFLFGGKCWLKTGQKGKALNHSVSTTYGCSGSPILVLDNNVYKVIGVHLGARIRDGCNYGSYFGFLKARKDSSTLASMFYDSEEPESAIQWSKSGYVDYTRYEDDDLAFDTGGDLVFVGGDFLVNYIEQVPYIGRRARRSAKRFGDPPLDDGEPEARHKKVVGVPPPQNERAFNSNNMKASNRKVAAAKANKAEHVDPEPLPLKSAAQDANTTVLTNSGITVMEPPSSSPMKPLSTGPPKATAPLKKSQDGKPSQVPTEPRGCQDPLELLKAVRTLDTYKALSKKSRQSTENQLRELLRKLDPSNSKTRGGANTNPQN